MNKEKYNMAKTQEELNKLKEEYEQLVNKLKELTEEELDEITGGHQMPHIADDEKYVL